MPHAYQSDPSTQHAGKPISARLVTCPHVSPRLASLFQPRVSRIPARSHRTAAGREGMRKSCRAGRGGRCGPTEETCGQEGKRMGRTTLHSHFGLQLLELGLLVLFFERDFRFAFDCWGRGGLAWTEKGGEALDVVALNMRRHVGRRRDALLAPLKFYLLARTQRVWEGKGARGGARRTHSLHLVRSAARVQCPSSASFRPGRPVRARVAPRPARPRQ